MQPSKSRRFGRFYEREAAQYHARRYGTRYGNLFRQLHHHVLRDLLVDVSPASNVLEIACGTGHTTELLASLGCYLIASDLTPQMMEQAQERLRASGSFVRTNAFYLPFPDNYFDHVVSTRFLHLFPTNEQRVLLVEMRRVLKPQGQLVVDFDNFASRWLLAIPYFFYNVIRYRRFAADSKYNLISPTEQMLQNIGFSNVGTKGLGGTHLILPALLSPDLAFRLGLRHRFRPLRIFAEQFMVSGRKTT